jgi:hypothetical protein
LLLKRYGLDIGLWHRLTIDPDTGGPKLSSRRLLVLLDEAVKWDEDKVIAAETHAELLRLRAAYNLVHGGAEATFDAEEHRFVSPETRESRAREAAEAAADEETRTARFNADIGFE